MIKSMKKSTNGFTIVELLIVVIVIAILAAIVTVVYNGVQERATNTAVRATARHAVLLAKTYITQNERYPYTGRACLTTSKCYNGSLIGSDATLNNNLGTVGSLPGSVPTWSTAYGGVLYDYNSNQTYNGVPSPVSISYFLKGSTAQNCDLDIAMKADTYGSNDILVTATRSYTTFVGGSSSTTICKIVLPPAQ